MTALDYLKGELARLSGSDLLRTAQPALPPRTIVACSNDYLGLAREPLDATSDEGSGAGASRLICGDHRAHRELEEGLAQWVGLEASLLFASGYAANVGAISALATRDDVVISDALNHASIIDGCRLSRAKVHVTPHRDHRAMATALALPESRAARRRFVVTETYFSMDGDSPDLRELRALCDERDAALIVDEAHALGIFGPSGGGLCREQGVVPDLLVGTLGKAVGMQGAFVAGPAVLREWLWNRARSFVFSTGPSPAMSAATLRRLSRVAAADSERARLHALSRGVRDALADAGAVIVEGSHGPIVPWLVGSASAALSLSRRLLDRGLYVSAIRPPTVPEGTARLRVTLHAALSAADRDRLVEILVNAARAR